MGLQNVEKIAVQENHNKTWFNRFKTKILVVTAGATALAVSSASNAFIKSADVTAATTAAGGEDTLSTTGIWIITICVGLAIVGMVVALIKKR